MQKIKNFFKKCKLPIIILGFIIYFIFLTYVAINHEQWLDEAQAWLLVRDLSFIDLIKQMQYEGHPCLWHLVILPLVKLNLPVVSLSIFTIILMLITAIIIIKKSPFSWPVKLAIILSAPFMYWYSIQSRVYSIIPMLMFALAITYNKRNEKPYLYALVLALLSNTHIMMMAFVAINSFIFFIENLSKFKSKETRFKYIKVFGIIALGVIICYLQISESLANNTLAHSIMRNRLNDNIIIDFILKCFYAIFKELNLSTGINITFTPLMVLIALMIVVLIIYGLMKSTKETIILLVSCGFQAIVCIYIWFSNNLRAAMFMFYFIYVAWIKYYDIKNNPDKFKNYWKWQIIVFIVCAITIPFGIKNAKLDINSAIAGGKPTAEFIKENLEEDAKYAVIIDYSLTPLASYFPKNTFYHPTRDDYCSFVNWDNDYRRIIMEDTFVTRLKVYFNGSKNAYIIHSKNYLGSYDRYMQNLENNGDIEEIYASPNNGMNESFWVYRVNDKFKN